MPFNGSGVFQRVRNWVADATAGIKIRADYHDAEDDGFAAGLSNCITKDGQTTITQNIPFNGKRITNLADPVNPQDAATKASSSAYADTNKVAKAGDTMTGDLTVSKASPSIVLNKASLGVASLFGKQATLSRWEIDLGDGSNELGSNVGSDFKLVAYVDAGTALAGLAVLTGLRATGLLTVRADPTAALGIATKQYVDNYPYQPKDAQLFAGIPLVSPSFPYTPVATDAQKCIAGSGALTLPTNAAVPFPIGTCISLIGGDMTISSSDNLYWQDGFNVRTGTRTLASFGMATAYRYNTNTWVLSGSGLT